MTDENQDHQPADPHAETEPETPRAIVLDVARLLRAFKECTEEPDSG